MNEYHLAVVFWSSIVLVALGSPFLAAFGREVVEAFEHLVHGSHGAAPPSLASVPSMPTPSSPGFD